MYSVLKYSLVLKCRTLGTKISHCRAVGQERLVGLETQTLVDFPKDNIVALDYQGKKIYRATLVVSVCHTSCWHALLAAQHALLYRGCR